MPGGSGLSYTFWSPEPGPGQNPQALLLSNWVEYLVGQCSHAMATRVELLVPWVLSTVARLLTLAIELLALVSKDSRVVSRIWQPSWAATPLVRPHFLIFYLNWTTDQQPPQQIGHMPMIWVSAKMIRSHTVMECQMEIYKAFTDFAKCFTISTNN